MKKSIETIWKEGFLNSDSIVTPKLNNLYNKKSEHIVDKFIRMFKINLVAITIGSVFILAMSWLVHIPYMGIGFFVLLNTLAYFNFKLRVGSNKIDKNVNSYQYLKSFDLWLNEMISINQKFSRIFYPLAILSVVAGFWFGEIGGDIPGENFVQFLLEQFPNMILVFGFPLYLLIGLFTFLALIAYSAGTIYKWDLNIVYGRIFKKLDEILADMEELRS